MDGALEGGVGDVAFGGYALTSVWVVLLGAAAAGVLTLALLPSITAIPRERWRMAGARPLALLSVSAAFFAGVLSIAFRAPPPWALGITFAGGLVALARLTLRYAPVRAVKRHTARLTNESQRAAAVAALGPALDRARPAAHDLVAIGAWAHAALIAAAYLVDADEPVAARGVLDRMGGIRLVGISATNQSLLWAHVELLGHRPEAARSALEAVQRPITMPLLEAHGEALETLALACEGKPSEALSRSARWKYQDGWYAKIRLTTRILAHALADDDARRRSTEHELERRFGKRAVAAAQQLVDAYAPTVDAP